MTGAHSWLLVIVAACGTRDRPETPPPAAAAITSFEAAWDRTRTCLFGTDAELLGLDPRDALPLADLKDFDSQCPELDALLAAVPPDAPELAAAVRVLPEVWKSTHYLDDTGNHTIYDSLEAFANGLRDVDDHRIAIRRAANLPASRLGARRIPLATISAWISDRTAHVREAPVREHVIEVVARSSALAFSRPDLSTPHSTAWATTIDEKTRALTVSEPAGVLVAAKVDGTVVRRLGSGRDRAIVVERAAEYRYSIFVSHDAGATWTIGLQPSPGVKLDGDPRALDLVVQGPPRWIHVGGDGIVAPAVPVIGIPRAVWTCATAEVVWLVDREAKVAQWTDRAGKRGDIPYTGHGGFGCAGRSLLAHSNAGNDIRCSADTGSCGDEISSLGYADLASDGVVVARATGSIITITRSGARPTMIRTRVGSGDVLEGFVMWSDVPTLVIRRDDRGLHLATPAP